MKEMELLPEKELKIIALEKKGKKRPVATKRALLAARVLFERTHTTTTTGEMFPIVGELEVLNLKRRSLKKNLHFERGINVSLLFYPKDRLII